MHPNVVLRLTARNVGIEQAAVLVLPMVRWAPKTDSSAAPRMCADECQNTVLESLPACELAASVSESNFSRVSMQSPISGRVRSHN
jgi:hypothetical protein